MQIFGIEIDQLHNFFVLLPPYLLDTAAMSFENDGVYGQGTTLRKSDTVRFVFDLFERRKFKSLPKTNAEVTPTDVYIRSRSVPEGYHTLNGTLLGALYIYRLRVFLCPFI